MDGIFKKDNVYVYVTNKGRRDDIQIEDMTTLVYSPDSKYEKQQVSLFGGRVYLNSTGYYYINMRVDGIRISHILHDNDLWFVLSDSWGLGEVTAFLNQMENLGIETFLENYKKQLVNFKKEMEEEVEKMEQEQSIHFDEKKVSSISNLKRAIVKLAIAIFCLFINMNAGLENQTYTDAYNEIINLYF